MYVLHSKMHAAGADGLAQAVIGVVKMVRENAFPALYEAGRNGLRPDMHEPPLGKLVIGKVHLPAFDGVQKVLGPGYKKPDDGGFFVGHRLKYPFGPWTPRRSTPRPPTRKLPNQCIFAPVW